MDWILDWIWPPQKRHTRIHNNHHRDYYDISYNISRKEKPRIYTHTLDRFNNTITVLFFWIINYPTTSMILTPCEPQKTTNNSKQQNCRFLCPSSSPTWKNKVEKLYINLFSYCCCCCVSRMWINYLRLFSICKF